MNDHRIGDDKAQKPCRDNPHIIGVALVTNGDSGRRVICHFGSLPPSLQAAEASQRPQGEQREHLVFGLSPDAFARLTAPKPILCDQVFHFKKGGMVFYMYENAKFMLGDCVSSNEQIYSPLGFFFLQELSHRFG